MKRSLISLVALLLGISVSAEQVALIGTEYTMSKQESLDSESEFIGINFSYYNFMGNDWFLGLGASFGEGDSNLCRGGICLELESEYTDAGIDIGYTFDYLTPFVGASRSDVEVVFEAGDIENLEVEGDSSIAVRLGLWTRVESWQFRLALEDADESKAVSIGAFSKIADWGLALAGFFESPIDSEVTEGYSLQLQIGLTF
jgi:hypothetical protein